MAVAAAKPKLYIDRGTFGRPEWVEVGTVKGWGSGGHLEGAWLQTVPDGTPVYVGSGIHEPAGTYEALGQVWALEAGRWLAGRLAVLLGLSWRFWSLLEAWADGDRPPRRGPVVCELGRGLYPNDFRRTYRVQAEEGADAVALLIATLQEEDPTFGLGRVDRSGLMTTRIHWEPADPGAWTIKVDKRHPSKA